MTKVLTFLAAFLITSGALFADGAINLTTWDSENPIYYLTADKLAGGPGFYAEVLAGPSQTAVVSTTAGFGAVFEITPDGNFDCGYGMATGVAPNTAAFITLRAWKGAATFEAASERASVSWTQLVGNAPPRPGLPVPALLNIPKKLIIAPVKTATVVWSNPADIVYGTALGATQLNASASVSGTFAYSPASGTVLKAGAGQVLSVTFTPADATYSTTTKTVSLNVLKAAPVISWQSPADLVYGTVLGGTQLNATANIDGTSVYNPASGTLLMAGTGQVLSVIFTPADTANYSAATGKVTLNVLKATPVLAWTAPSDIVYGTALSTAQLNASANIDGSFAYNPAIGAVLKPGLGQVLSVAFTPADTANYTVATKTVNLNVLKAPPELAAISDRMIVQGQELLVTLEGHQIDTLPSQLTYWLVNGPANATVSADGLLRWIPDAAQAPSTNHFQVAVSDGMLGATNAFTVEVFDLAAVVNGMAVLETFSSLPPVTISIRNRSRPDWLAFYSLDGTEPSNASLKYVESIALQQSSTVWPVLYSPDFSQRVLGLPVRINMLKEQTLTVSVDGSLVFLGPAMAVNATASSGLPVSLEVLSGPGRLEGNNLLPTGGGAVVIRATQAGDAVWGAAIVTNRFAVSPAAQTILWATLTDQTYGAPPVTLNATASSGLPVGFRIVSGPATVAENKLTLTGVGAVAVASDQPGDANYLAADSVTNTFAVSRGAQTISFAQIGDQVLGGNPITLQASSSVNLDVAFAVLSGPATILGNQLTLTNAGTVVVQALNPGDSLYLPAQAEQSFTIRDATAPLITMVEPTSGSTQNEQATLRGSIVDNVGVASARWLRDGTAQTALVLGADGVFRVEGLILNRGVNAFEVEATDAAGNSATQRVEVAWAPSRTLYAINPAEVQEGKRVSMPILLSSQGDVAGMSFAVKYDTNYLREPELTWPGDLSAGLNQVRYDPMGVIRADVSLPATGGGVVTSQVAQITFRVRSVPIALDTKIQLEVLNVLQVNGEPISYGTEALPGSVAILPRRFTGDNNANNRLDIGDATLIQRMIAGMEEVRAWDADLNDLNGSGIIDSDDVIEVLRTVIGINAQPSMRLAGVSSLPVIKRMRAGGQMLALAKPEEEAAVLIPSVLAGAVGQVVTVQVVLTNIAGSVAGVSFVLDYPTNAVRLLNAQSHQAGTLVPLDGTEVLWNVAPAATDYSQQSGRISFAASSAHAWVTNQGVLAEFSFQVQAGAVLQPTWPITLSQVEMTGNGFEVGKLPDALASFSKVASRLPPVFVDGSSDYLKSGFSFMIEGQAGEIYGIETSTTLTNWLPLATVTNLTGSVEFTDTTSTNMNKRFYRAVLKP